MVRVCIHSRKVDRLVQLNTFLLLMRRFLVGSCQSYVKLTSYEFLHIYLMVRKRWLLLFVVTWDGVGSLRVCLSLVWSLIKALLKILECQNFVRFFSTAGYCLWLGQALAGTTFVVMGDLGNSGRLGENLTLLLINLLNCSLLLLLEQDNSLALSWGKRCDGR